MSDMVPARARSSLILTPTINSRFILKLAIDMIITYTQVHRTNKYSQHSSIIWAVWLNGLVFFYVQSGYGFKSHSCHLNFRYATCFEQWVPRHWGKPKSADSLWNSYVTWKYHTVKCNVQINTHNTAQSFGQAGSIVECSLTYWAVLGSNFLAVTQTSDMTPASSKECLDIQANYRVWIHSGTRMWLDITCSQMHCTDKYSQHRPTTWPVWPNVFSVPLRNKCCGFT